MAQEIRDLGTYMYEQQKGAGKSEPIPMIWTFYNLAWVGPNKYNSWASQEMNGEVFEVIVELDDAAVRKMLTLLPEPLSTALELWASRPKSCAEQLDFEDDVAGLRPQLGLETRLGDTFKRGGNKYTPFVVRNVVRAEDML